MVKMLLVLLILFNLSFSKEKNIYEKNCLACHKKIPVSIDKYFYKYLLTFSSEEEVKNAMFDFLRNPSKEKSLMSESLIKRFGLKKKSKLSDEELKEALDIYWEEYKLFGKLK